MITTQAAGAGAWHTAWSGVNKYLVHASRAASCDGPRTPSKIHRNIWRAMLLLLLVFAHGIVWVRSSVVPAGAKGLCGDPGLAQVF